MSAVTTAKLKQAETDLESLRDLRKIDENEIVRLKAALQAIADKDPGKALWSELPSTFIFELQSIAREALK